MRRGAALLLLLLVPSCSELIEPSGSGGGGYDESQDGVFFVSNRYGIASVYDIFRMNADGAGVENVTQAPAQYYGRMALSPDGTRLAFVTDRVGCYHIWVMNVDGTDPIQLTDADPGLRWCDEFPYWSPDGSRIAFLSSRQPDQGWQVYVMNADGSDPTRVSVVANPPPGSIRPLGWSPDGRVVFEYVNVTATTLTRTIYTVMPDGTGAEPLFDEAGGYHPAWSPDGERLAFVRTQPDHHDLVVRDPDGTEETLVTFESGSYTGLSGMVLTSTDRSPWSPDGSRIAFSWARQIYVVDVDGEGEPYRLTSDDHSSNFVGWSPDGSRIVFTSNRTGASDIYVINADGTGLLNLTHSPASDCCALWLPAR